MGQGRGPGAFEGGGKDLDRLCVLLLVLPSLHETDRRVVIEGLGVGEIKKEAKAIKSYYASYPSGKKRKRPEWSSVDARLARQSDMSSRMGLRVPRIES